MAWRWGWLNRPIRISVTVYKPGNRADRFSQISIAHAHPNRLLTHLRHAMRPLLLVCLRGALSEQRFYDKPGAVHSFFKHLLNALTAPLASQFAFPSVRRARHNPSRFEQAVSRLEIGQAALSYGKSPLTQGMPILAPYSRLEPKHVKEPNLVRMLERRRLLTRCIKRNNIYTFLTGAPSRTQISP